MTAETAQAPTATVLVDNDRVRVVHWTVPPMGETGWHRHELDYLSVQLTNGRLRIDAASGEAVFVDLTEGATIYVAAPQEHNIVNVGPTTIVTVDIELK